MDGRAFLDVARELASGPTEAHWRAAAGRASYGLFHEIWAVFLRWSFSIPPRENVHSFLRLRFTFAAEPGVNQIGMALESLGQLRNKADYKLATPGLFATNSFATLAVDDALANVVLLDQIDGDPTRRAAAVAAIRAAWP
jgi:hypothetical protein